MVASEVRALAQRSAEAAKEIKALISTSAAGRRTAWNWSAETGKALERIIAQVSEINSVVAEIAARARRSRRPALQQINSAINQMDQVDAAERSHGGGIHRRQRSLSQEMGLLAKLVEQFRVDEPTDAHLRPN